MAADVEPHPSASQHRNPADGPVYDFSFSDFLRREHGFGLDKHRPVCKAFLQGHCPAKTKCPDKHPSNYQNLVCKHWLRGLCKKGDMCEYLHEYNLRSMPECTHYARQGICPNGSECLYLHIDPRLKEPPCPHYERGFCPLGPYCGARHVKKKTFCQNYLAGFCPDGKDCKLGAHPVWHEKDELKKPQVRVVLSKEEEEQQREQLKEQLIQKMDREREDDAGKDERDRSGSQAGFRGNRAGRGRKQWGSRGRKQF